MGATPHRSVALNNLGEVHFDLGDLDAAAECYLQALDIAREFGGQGEGHALHNLGRVYTRQHRLEEAVATLKDALVKFRAAGELDGEAWTLKSLGNAHAEVGNVAEARASLTEGLRIFEQIANQEQAAETAALLASLPDGSGQR
jgi:tetratricopeptide (TPR) repeat protein